MTSASNKSGSIPAWCRIAGGALLAAAAVQAQAAAVTLCAEPYGFDLPGTPAVPMWGYRAVATAAECNSPVPRIAATNPVIDIAAGDTSLTVTLVNRLNVPTSIVIAGQALPGGAGAAVMAADVVGPACVPDAGAAASAPTHPQNCRVRSFVGETPPGAAQVYTFSNLRPGSFLYQSGTHPQVQVQMGLAGLAVVRSSAPQPYASEAAVLLSEVDPVMHAKIAATLGSADPTSWKAGGNSTLNYAPRYFLVNGRVFGGIDATGAAATDIAVSASAGTAIGLRLANAGLQSRTLMLTNGTLRLLGEDGYPYPAPREQATVFIPAGKTTEALLPAAVNTDGTLNRSIVFFDRRGGSDNFDGTMLGGQVARLAITNAGPAANQPPLVNAGPDQLINAAAATLAGTVTDDGQVVPFTTAWTQVAGPGTVSFASNAPATTATLPGPGRYTLRLSANDGQYQPADDVVVTYNTPPVVNAGADRTVRVAGTTLVGSVVDDGLPNPVPATTWSLVSGPAGATATFATPSAASSAVSFSALGAYTLRLSANDGQLVVADNVVVTVAPGKHVANLTQAAIAAGTLPWSGAVTIAVHNALHAPVQGAVVSGTWTGGGTTLLPQCITNAAGQCSIGRLAIPFAQTSVSFTVTNVTAAAGAGPYNAANNHDPDPAGPQASNGTTITMLRP